jgi:hypothetical protein
MANLRRYVAAPLVRDLFLGAEPVFYIVAVSSSALLVEFVGAAANVIFQFGCGFLLPQ